MVGKLFSNTWLLFKALSILAFVMLGVFMIDQNVDVESALIYFIVFRLAIYTAILWGLPLYICRKLNIEKDKFLNDNKIKKQLFKVKGYLSILFILVEALMIYRGVWL